MNDHSSFNACLEQAVKNHWLSDALTDYKGATLQYHDVARKIEKLHIGFAYVGISRGDKIAICGRNSAHWATAFLAVLTYGAVAVPVQHEWGAEQIHNVVNHSDARLLFVGDYVGTTLEPEAMPRLEGIINLPDFSVHTSRSERLTYAREHLNELFGRRYPKAFGRDDISWHRDAPEELAIINYTSGTTGFSKGVMLPYRALWGNLDCCREILGSHVPEEASTLSILPMAHMYGMAIEFFFPFCHGCHLFFLNRLPSPSLIAEVLAEVKPAIVIAVPLIVEKIIRKRVFPHIQSNAVKLLLQMPVVNRKVKQRLTQEVREAFGGRAYEVVVGGAALNQEIEQFLVSIGFPLTVGYGTTECAPLISLADHHDFVAGSCGKTVKNMEVRIDSTSPTDIPGEILARGQNVMLGYYKNEEATHEAIDADGWYHTGDLGTLSADGHLFIRGRIKNMLLGANGQNVYPEEIEDKLNSMAMVNESLVVQDGERLVALVHPEYDEATEMGFSEDDLKNIMEQNRIELNRQLPAYSKIQAVRLCRDEFEKTPKKSIKRYLYK